MKYYVSIDDFGPAINLGVIHAGSSYQACIIAMRRKFTLGRYNKGMGKYFRVSQRGFEIHEDDELIPSETIINLLLLSNSYEPPGEKDV